VRRLGGEGVAGGANVDVLLERDDAWGGERGGMGLKDPFLE
jgi:hypothetical protein